MAGTPRTGAALGSLTPEQLRAYLEPFGQEEDELQRQLHVADALRNWQQPQSYGLGAGIGNGLASVFKAIDAHKRETAAQEQLKALQGRETSSAIPLAQQFLINALRNRGDGQAPAPQQGLQADPYAPPPMSYET